MNREHFLELSDTPATDLVVASNTDLSSPLRRVARVIWLALVIPSFLIFAAGLPVYYQQLQKACTDAVTCSIGFALMPKGLQAMAALGITANEYAALLTVFWVIIVAIWTGIGLLVFWRGSSDWFVLLGGFALVMFNITYPGLSATALSMFYPVVRAPIQHDGQDLR